MRTYAKVYLSLVFHNHQPVGNFDSVFAAGHDKSYLKLVELLERHNKVHVGLHFSGPLRDWIVANRPELFERIRKLVERGQVEILGGAYYEPILVMLSDEDKIGQMKLLNEAVEKDFGAPPAGMWLAEQVWEPSLAKPIAEAGLRYTIVDDTHLMSAVWRNDDLLGYFVTEEQGYTLNIFPTSTKMRSMFPSKDVPQVMSWLESLIDHKRESAATIPPLVFMGNDGEKFGLWPGTYERVWQGGYMDTFFTALEDASEWLQAVTPTEYMSLFPALGRTYMPAASYSEMAEWSLSAEQSYELTALRHQLEHELEAKRATDSMRVAQLETILRYLRGGFWRNFFLKYPEVNHMDKRGIFTSRRVNALPDGDIKRKALPYVWASQCNAAYWHGLFGGIYLFHIRVANYANMLAAEALILPTDTIEIVRQDFDRDTREEIIVNSSPFVLVFDLVQGGTLIEWDDIPSLYNIVNVMSRQREAYHTVLEQAAAKGKLVTPDDPAWSKADSTHSNTPTVRAKEIGLEDYLIVDQHRHATFIDHFIGTDVTLDQFRRAKYHELGDFVDGVYVASTEGADTPKATILLWREGGVKVDGHRKTVRVEKQVTVEADSRQLIANYAVTNHSDALVYLRFGVEVSYGLDGGDSDQCYVHLPRKGDIPGYLGEAAAHEGVASYAVGTYIRGFEVSVQMGESATLWHYPLEPVTNSESGFEKLHQGAVFLHIFELELPADERWATRMVFTIRDISAPSETPADESSTPETKSTGEVQ